MKKSKKRHNFRFKSMVTIILMCIYWIWMLHTTQTATTGNTIQRQEAISRVELRLASHRGTDKLYIFTQSNKYMLDTGWRDEVKSHNLANELRAIDTIITITVWEHVPKWILDSKNPFKVCQAVDLRDTNNVYWDISTHNEYQQIERTSGSIVGIPFSVILLAFVFFSWRFEK